MTNLLENFASETEVAEATGKDRRTLRLWRQQRKGPAWAKVGQSVFYPRKGFETWLEKMVIDPDAQDRRRA